MIDSLTSLRFFAAYAIVLHHSRGLIFQGDFLPGAPLASGVSFFFVLSGFILAYVYSDNIVSAGKLKFYSSRIAKIWPTHLLTMLLSAAFFPSFEWTLGAANEGLVATANATLLHSLVPIPSYYFSFNSVSWSISTEMFFYIFFPVLVASLEKTWLLKTILLLALGGIGAYTLDQSGANYYSPGKLTEFSGHGLAYINPVFRIQEFFIGIMFYKIYDGIKSLRVINKHSCSLLEIAAVFGVALLTKKIVSASYAYWSVSPASAEFWSHSLQALLFGVVILIFAFNKGFLSSFLSHRPFVMLGEISFALYMIHQIVFRFYASHKALLPTMSEYVALSVLSCIAIFLAYLIWKFYEIPTQVFLKKLLFRFASSRCSEAPA